MEPVMLRIPPEFREKAKKIARDVGASEGKKYTESDVYRTAIRNFFDGNFTDSTDERRE